jgi:hypothetical protein
MCGKLPALPRRPAVVQVHWQAFLAQVNLGGCRWDYSLWGRGGDTFARFCKSYKASFHSCRSLRGRSEAVTTMLSWSCGIRCRFSGQPPTSPRWPDSHMPCRSRPPEHFRRAARARSPPGLEIGLGLSGRTLRRSPDVRRSDVAFAHPPPLHYNVSLVKNVPPRRRQES